MTRLGKGGKMNNNSVKIEIYINDSVYAHKIEYGRGKI
jgi:hypothetical protein